MKSICIDYHEAGSFSPVVTGYLEQYPKLSPFFSFPPTIAGFQQIISNKKISANRELLVRVLKEQYQRVHSRASIVHSSDSGTGRYNQSSDIVNKNIELLLKENTYTITTGHQLNIFTGPLYFIYKIVTAIKLADDLKKALPDHNFVPLYWMATEDHDFEEINHANLGEKKLVWNASQKGATGCLKTESMVQVIKEYISLLGISENAAKLSAIIMDAYKNHSLLADATRELVNMLFGDFGLVILDADNRELKQQFVPVIERDILEQNSFREINETSTRLLEAGFKTAVSAREINFFYLDEEFRERIVYKDGNYHILNSSLRFTEDELKKEIKANPEKFSPNVVLRPLYQEMILPNLAYIGGGSEVVYWLQLKQMFDFYDLDFPILILRNSAMLADEAMESKLQKLELGFKDIFKEPDRLKKEWVLNHTEHDLTLSEEWKQLQLIFDKIKSRSSKIDPTLVQSTAAVSVRLQKALLNLEKKLLRAEKRNHAVALSQIENIKNKLFPGGVLQERSENFGLYYVKYGDELIRELMRHFKPLDFKFTILY